MLKISVFPAQDDATFWYRALWPLRTMADRGECEFKTYFHGEKYSLDADLIIFQRNVTEWYLDIFEQARGKVPVVYDIDDDVPNLDPRNVAQLVLGHDRELIRKHYRALVNTPNIEHTFPVYARLLGLTEQQVVDESIGNFDRLIYFVSHADLVTVSTRSLAKTYRGWGGKCKVLPNMESEREWKGITRAPLLNRIVLGWAGGASHYFNDLQPIVKPVTEVMKLDPRVHLHLIGVPEAKAFFPGAPQDRIFTESWQGWESYKSIVAEFDVTLAPSFGTKKFAEGKSDIRVLQSWMNGIPVVASPLTYKETVERGGGKVCTTPNEWFQALKGYLDGDVRRRDGALGKEYVLRERTIERQVQSWTETYKELLETRTKNPQERPGPRL